MVLTNSQIAIVTTTTVGIAVAWWIYRTIKSESDETSNKTVHGDNRLMKLNATNHIELPPKLALVTDLDHTLFGPDTIPNETHEQSNQHILNFNDIWCNEYATNGSVLIYATGRNFEKYKLAVEEWDILIPDVLVSQDGVTIHWFNKHLAQQVQARSTHKIDMSFDDSMDDCDFVWLDTSWTACLEQGWDQTFAEKVGNEVSDKFSLLPLPKGSCAIEPFRIGVLCKGQHLAKQIESYYIKRVTEYNEQRKNDKGFVAMDIHTFTCIERNMKHNDAYWSAFTPQRAGKGQAIEFIKRRLHLKERDIICCGDSGNDISMLAIDGINSVIVANASQELLDFYEARNEDGQMIKTKRSKTLGVIEGLFHYGPSLLKYNS